MIKYSLRCENDHRFESWFQNSDAFVKLQNAGMIACAICGHTGVEKAIMAPRVKSGKQVDADVPEPMPDAPLSGPPSQAEQALRDLRKKIEASSDDVGEDFAKEARAIHNGDAPERAIIGEARLKDAKDLIDDGIPVAPLPWTSRKPN